MTDRHKTMLKVGALLCVVAVAMAVGGFHAPLAVDPHGLALSGLFLAGNIDPANPAPVPPVVPPAPAPIPASAPTPDAALEARVAEQVAGLKKKNDELLAELAAAKPRLALLGDRRPEEIEAALKAAQAAADEKLAAAGNYTALKTQMTEYHDKIVQAKDAEILREKTRSDAAEAGLHTLLITNTARVAIRDAGMEEEVMLPHIERQLKAFVEDGKHITRVVDEKGAIRVSDALGTPMTVEQLVESYRDNPKFSGVVKAGDANGGGARNRGPLPINNGTIIIPKNSTPQEYRRLKAEAEKLGRPFAIAAS